MWEGVDLCVLSLERGVSVLVCALGDSAAFVTSSEKMFRLSSLLGKGR